MRHFMLDLETLGVRSTCVIAQVAMCEFDPNADAHTWEMAGTSCFNAYLDVQGQLQRGTRTVDLGTIDFWVQQGSMDYNLFHRTFFGGDHPRVTLNGLAFNLENWLDRCCPKEERIVWAYPTRFDVAAIETLYPTDNAPWLHNATRDLKTLRSLVADQGAFSTLPVGRSHDALSDVEWQARCVMLARALIKSGPQHVVERL